MVCRYGGLRLVTATKRSPNCEDCDCCYIYQSNFCGQLVIAGTSYGYLGSEWEDETSPGVNSWSISTTDGGCVDLSCPDVNKPFARGVVSSTFPGRRAVFNQSLPDRYHSFFDVELFYDSSLTGTYNIGIDLIVDYLDDDNYHSVKVTYDPSHDTGYAIVFDIIKVTAGSEDVIASLVHTLPSAVTNWRGLIEVAISDCTGGGDLLELSVPSVSISHAVRMERHDGKKLAMAFIYSQMAAATTYDCSGVVTSIPQHVRVYQVYIKRNEQDRTGCEEIGTYCCSCGELGEYDVTFSGYAGCDACTDLNGTYTLVWNTGTLGCTNWGYEFDYYSRPSCTVELHGKDCTLTITKITLYVLDNIFTLFITAQIVVDGEFGTGNACGYFNWTFTDGTADPPRCDLTSSDSWTYVTNSSSTSACKEHITGTGDVYFNLDDFCSTIGTVNVENG